MKTSLHHLRRILAHSFALGILLSLPSFAENPPARADLAVLARQATSPNATQAQPAIEALRTAGPSGLQALSTTYAPEIAAHFQNPAKADESWERLHAVFDFVGAQRDDYVSQLYWFTDLEKAKAAAHATGKPILSLRLLGKLSDEYSCANSRFFRTTLYSNTKVAQYLRDHFILHWQSVRPVPVITIDMGDGREIKRTITGNSIHYILDADGRPIDALPGLYSASAFMAGLTRAVTAESEVAKLDPTSRAEFLKNYHANELARVRAAWAKDLAQVQVSPKVDQNPSALAASLVAVSKTGVERPLVTSVTANSDADWTAMAKLHANDTILDASTLRLIREKQPALEPAMQMTFSKRFVETPMMRMVRNLTQSIAEDTLRNEYQLHARLHEWFANGSVPADLAALNAKVYAELFLTPDSDPWLGLAPADTFSALDQGGLLPATR